MFAMRVLLVSIRQRQYILKWHRYVYLQSTHILIYYPTNIVLKATYHTVNKYIKHTFILTSYHSLKLITVAFSKSEDFIV